MTAALLTGGPICMPAARRRAIPAFVRSLSRMRSCFAKVARIEIRSCVECVELGIFGYGPRTRYLPGLPAAGSRLPARQSH